jgi:hypothetical protein
MGVTDETPYLPKWCDGGRTGIHRTGLLGRYAKRIHLSKVGAIEITTAEPKNPSTLEALL